MTSAYAVRVESDDRGFELHLELDEDVSTDDGRLIVNVQAVAEELYDAVKQAIGPWLQEMEAARREYDSGIANDPAEQELLDRIRGASFHDGADRLAEAADHVRKAEQENS